VDNVTYRKYDSDDIVRIRSKAIVTSTEGKDTKVNVDTGILQKVAIILGIGSCEWFSDSINEDIGITDEIFNKRYKSEFRKIPVNLIDVMFKETQEYNKADFNVEELKKKLD
jgi:hypothetical protein